MGPVGPGVPGGILAAVPLVVDLARPILPGPVLLMAGMFAIATGSPAASPAAAMATEEGSQDGEEDEDEEDEAEEVEEPTAEAPAPAVSIGWADDRRGDARPARRACGKAGLVDGPGEPDRQESHEEAADDPEESACVRPLPFAG